jgi:hypothetical protein
MLLYLADDERFWMLTKFRLLFEYDHYLGAHARSRYWFGQTVDSRALSLATSPQKLWNRSVSNFSIMLSERAPLLLDRIVYKFVVFIA